MQGELRWWFELPDCVELNVGRRFFSDRQLLKMQSRARSSFPCIIITFNFSLTLIKCYSCSSLSLNLYIICRRFLQLPLGATFLGRVKFYSAGAKTAPSVSSRPLLVAQKTISIHATSGVSQDHRREENLKENMDRVVKRYGGLTRLQHSSLSIFNVISEFRDQSG